MPIPVNKYNHEPATESIIQQQHNDVIITIQALFHQIIDLVLSSRLNNQQQEGEKQRNYCLVNHELCCLNIQQQNDQTDNSCIIINILQKESDILLERWMMSFDIINNTTNNTQQLQSQEFITTITNFILNESPTKKELIELYTIACLNNLVTCHSFNSRSDQERIEFRSDAHLKAKRFHLPNLLLEVVYDENINICYESKKKLPVISLQSLSSPSFMSWSKMQQLAPNNTPSINNGGSTTVGTEGVHPLSTAATINNTSSHIKISLPQQYQQHIPIIAVRRLSRLSLSAMQLEHEQDEEEQAKEEDEDVIMQDINTNITSIPIPTPRMQYTTHHHHHGHSASSGGGGILRSTIAYSTSPINSHNTHHYQHHHHHYQQQTTSTSFTNTSFLSPNQASFLAERRNSLTEHNHYHHKSLVGSFEESLLSGRMSSMPSKSIQEFQCQIGVLGYGDNCKPSLKCPPHWNILFQATYYINQEGEGDEAAGGTPYVGTIDLQDHSSKLSTTPIGYRIPPKGQLQVVVKNPNKTAVKLFLIPYDFTDMPKNSKTFLRQKSYTLDTPQQLLRYAIHLQFCRNEKKRIYLYKSMRIVFANRKADSREKFNVVIEDPGVPKYLAL